MNQDIQNLIKLLLNFHKELLELEKRAYEKKNGKIVTNGDYFNLVVSHPDFNWLRSLSEVIAIIDEEGEQKEIDWSKINTTLGGLQLMLESNEKIEFSKRYVEVLNENAYLLGLNGQVKSEIEKIIKLAFK